MPGLMAWVVAGDGLQIHTGVLVYRCGTWLERGGGHTPSRTPTPPHPSIRIIKGRVERDMDVLQYLR